MTFNIPAGQAKSVYVKDRFSVIAGRYDLFNDIITQGMHRYWKAFLVKKAQLEKGNSALDICCGTGDITQRLLKAVGDSGCVTGLDFAAGMLAIARSRNSRKQVRLIQGDAVDLPIKDNSQDAVTVGFGLRNLTDITTCLSEVFRVLKPGGRFISLDMGKVTLPVARTIFRFYFFKIVPRIGKRIYPGETFFEYFPHSSLTYPSQQEMAELLSQVGFTGVGYDNFHLGSTVIHQARKPFDRRAL